MKTKILSVISAFLFAGASALAQGMFTLSSGMLDLPNRDGSFSGQSSAGASVSHTYYHISAADFAAFSSADAKAIYEAHIANGIPGKFHDETVTKGYTRIYPDDDPDLELEEDIEYFAAVFTYEADNRVFYIARVFESALNAESEDEFDWFYTSVFDIATSAGRWRYVGDDIPAEPPAVECTAFSVANGVVSATYSISDFSRLGEIVENGSATASIARDVSGASGLAAVAATVTATDATASSFTVEFAAPEGWNTLFLFGFGESGQE